MHDGAANIGGPDRTRTCDLRFRKQLYGGLMPSVVKKLQQLEEESFNATVRLECLGRYWFLDLDDARERLKNGVPNTTK